MRRLPPPTLRRPKEVAPPPQDDLQATGGYGGPPSAPTGPRLPGLDYDPGQESRPLGPVYPHQAPQPVYNPLTSQLSEYAAPGKDYIAPSHDAWPPAPSAPAWKSQDVKPIPKPDPKLDLRQPLKPAPLPPQKTLQVKAEDDSPPEDASASVLANHPAYAANL